MKTSEEKTKPISLKANAMWNSIGCFFYMGCQWIVTVLVVVLSPNYDNSGILAFAMSVGLVFFAIGTYSIRPFQVSDIKNEYSPQNYIALRIVTNVGAYFFCIVYLLIITQRLDLIVSSILYLLFKFDESFVDVLYGTYQKNGRMDYIGKSQFIRGIVSLSCFSIPLWLTKNIDLSILCMFISCLMVSLLFDFPHAKLFGSIKPEINKSIAWTLLKTCFTAMLANLMLTYVVSAVRQYYGIIEGDAALGVYAAIATPAVVVQAAIGYLYTPFIVPLADSFHKSRTIFLRSFLKISLILAGSIIALSVILCIIGPPFLLLFFGESISQNLGIFPFVIISTSLIGLLGYMLTTLITMRKQRFACAMTTIAFLASISSAITFISAFDMNGVNLGIITGSLAGLAFGLGCVILCRNPCWEKPATE